MFAGLNETVNTPITFFAPSNEAWDKAAVVANLTVDELLNLTLSDPEILVAVLSYHIHPGVLLASQVVLGANVSTALPRVNLTAARIATESLIRSVAQPLSSTVDTNLTVLSVVPSIIVASAWPPDISNATVTSLISGLGRVLCMSLTLCWCHPQMHCLMLLTLLRHLLGSLAVRLLGRSLRPQENCLRLPGSLGVRLPGKG